MASDGKIGKLLQKRLIRFGGRTTRVTQSLPKTEERRYIAQQLLRSGLAAAPNYAEARAAESRADFIHKLRVVLKELNETESWLEQIVENGLYSRDKMGPIIAENQELCFIIAGSIRTAWTKASVVCDLLIRRYGLRRQKRQASPKAVDQGSAGARHEWRRAYRKQKKAVT